MPETGTPGSESGGRKRAHGDRTAARCESAGSATDPLPVTRLPSTLLIRFAQTDAEAVEGLLRVAAALALAEVLARDSAVRKAGTVRRNVNDILRNAFSEA